MYVTTANLRVCSRCKSNIDISYFGMSRKKNLITLVIIVEVEITHKKNKATRKNVKNIESDKQTKQLEKANNAVQDVIKLNQ